MFLLLLLFLATVLGIKGSAPLQRTGESIPGHPWQAGEPMSGYLQRAGDCDTGCNNYNSNEIQCCTCIDNIIGFIDIDGCADIYIDWDDLDIEFVLELNDTVLFDTEFGFDHPPELCIDIWGTNYCVDFEDMNIQNGVFTGCLHLVIDNDLDINFGCWRLENDH